MSLNVPEQRVGIACARETDVCEACGDSFACGVTLAGCWCARISLSESVLEELRAKYQRCLCRACLESFKRDESQSIVEPVGSEHTTKGRDDGEKEE